MYIPIEKADTEIGISFPSNNVSNEIEASAFRPVSKISSLNFLMQIPFEDYFHGSLERHEAEQILVNQDEGTFLVRENNNGYRISRTPDKSGLRRKHFILNVDENGRFSIDHKKF